MTSQCLWFFFFNMYSRIVDRDRGDHNPGTCNNIRRTHRVWKPRHRRRRRLETSLCPACKLKKKRKKKKGRKAERKKKK